jgi:hypothetical protein
MERAAEELSAVGGQIGGYRRICEALGDVAVDDDCGFCAPGLPADVR